MPRPQLSNVVIERTRHGRSAYYYRKGKGRRIRLPNDYGSEAFLLAVADAADGKIPARLPRFYTFNKNQRGNVGHAINAALRGASARARAKSLPFDIDFAWVVERVERQGFCCALSGVAFFCDRSFDGPRNPYAPSLDRIDCAGGYTKDNVRVVAHALNIMLSDWGPEVFQRIANGVRRANKSPTSIPALKYPESRTHKNGE